MVVEAGITLKKLLTWSFKKKKFLPVLPGQPDITIGGCVAANVHGKNPYKDSTIMEHIEWIELFHPSLGTKILSRTNDEKIFYATLGGLGLTGIITKVAIRLQTLPSDEITISTQKTQSLHASTQARFASSKLIQILGSSNNGVQFTIKSGLRTAFGRD